MNFFKLASKNTVFSTFGTAVEYYDFVIYGMLTDIINRVFFEGQLINGNFNFIIGYVARPLGSAIFGAIADNLGRKKAFNLSMILISISTLLMGILPSGAWTMIILLRIIQGIAFGSEMPNAVTIAIESSKSSKIREHGFILSGSAMGSIIGSFMCFAIFKFLSNDEVIDFGWRIPFIFGGVVSLIVFFIRKNLSESLLVTRKEFFSHTIKGIFKNFPQIIFSIIVILFPAVLIITNLHLPGILSSMYELDRSYIHIISTIGIALMMFVNPFLSHLFNLPSYIYSLVFLVSCVLSYVCFINLQIVPFFIFYQFVISLSLFYFMQLVCESFEQNFRVTGVGISYNTAFILSSFCVFGIRNLDENFSYIILYFALFILSIIFLRNKSKSLS
jgi:MFS family permease